MFVYLSKKVAIPNNTALHSVSWNKNQGYIACGGEDGLLKVLKLELGKDTGKGVAAPSNLSINQTLEGHSGIVEVVTWNEGPHQKLTSSDQYGLIIVWALYKGSWYEEMINNRNKSVVRDMVWNSDGQKICIVYDDGAVIVGSVDGNRIWGKELKGMHLTNVEWSPDGRLILFGLQNGEVHVYDNTGSSVSRINIQCLMSISMTTNLAGIHWYNGKGGHVEEDCPSLIVAYKNGRIQIMRHENDENPVLVDTGITIVRVDWNHNGTMFAIAGVAKIDDSASKECNVVQFYGPFGQHLRTLKVPGKRITGCSWEGGGLRIALAVDSFIYFANVRPDYKWCYFTGTVVYTYFKPDRSDTCVVFWNINGKERHIKYVKHLISLAASSEYCVLSTKMENDNGQYALVICNAIGTPIDSKYVEIETLHLCLTESHIIAASKEQFLVWHYRTPLMKSHLGLGSEMEKETKESVYHIDDAPSGFVDIAQELGNMYEQKRQKAGKDPICCLTASDKVLVIARESGVVQQYRLPDVALVQKYTLPSRPHRITLNCTSKRLAIIDVTGQVLFLDLDATKASHRSNVSTDNIHRSDRKDVWDMKWSAENDELFAVLEKTRMYVFKNFDPEEPITSSGYICAFEDLQIRTVLLDELLKDPENPNPDLIVDIEVKSLRDTRDLLEKVGIGDATAFIEENSHPRLWRLLAEAALDKLDLQTAETAFVRCKDYPAIQFIKRLNDIQNPTLRSAEIAAYFKRFDEAEKLYLEVDRRDLAVGLRRKLGDWFRVVQLLKSGAGGDDSVMEEAWNNIGDYFMERQKWEEAVKYYEQSCNQERLIECYYMLEEYFSLENLMHSLPEEHKLLTAVARMFSTVGMCEQAVFAYVKCNKIKAAIDCCVNLNQWNMAIELAEKHNVPETGMLLSKYAQHLLEKNKILSAIQLFHKAKRFLDAAKLLYKVAQEERKKKAKPLMMKKLYVLAGLIIEEYHKNFLGPSAGKGSKLEAKATLSGLLEEEVVAFSTVSDTKLVDNSWKGAEAYHFYMLAHRQLYGGYFDAAMKTALLLQDYDDILEPEDVYSLLALSSCVNQAYGTCSKAFIKLEALEGISTQQREAYEELAMEIFLKHPPKDSKVEHIECPTCDSSIPDWSLFCPNCDAKFQVCIATGRPIHNNNVWTCPTCKHVAASHDMLHRACCPLCHSYSK